MTLQQAFLSKDVAGKQFRCHILKTWPELYSAVVDPNPRLRKTVEIRKADRDYHVGDYLFLREYDPATDFYTGRSTWRLITHTFNATPWLPKGYIAMSIMDESPFASPNTVSA